MLAGLSVGRLRPPFLPLPGMFVVIMPSFITGDVSGDQLELCKLRLYTRRLVVGRGNHVVSRAILPIPLWKWSRPSVVSNSKA